MLRCIESWKKYCSDYQIIEWNETNFDIDNTCDFVRDAYKYGKWAFVSDYARLKVIYENGGIYLDTDVEIIKPLDELLKVNPYGYMGFEQEIQVNSGIGFCAAKGNDIVREMMNEYKTLTFNIDMLDKFACPIINTNVLAKHGLQTNGKMQQIEGLTILPMEYLCPENMYTGEVNYTKNTFSIHHYSASWLDKKNQRRMKLIVCVKRTLPKRIVQAIRSILSKNG